MTTTIELLSNPSFERGWTNLLPWNGTTNQQPLGYSLYIRLPGSPLLSADSYTGPDDKPVYTKVAVVPECIHKLRSQLPDADQLILAGDIVYKLFANSNPFSVDLVAAAVMPADGELHISMPVQVHQHGDGSIGAAVWRLIVNDWVSGWHTFGCGFADREWAFPIHDMHVKAGQAVMGTLQMESCALGGIDFFTDAWSFEFSPTEQLETEPEQVDYEVVVNLLPQDATLGEKAYVVDIVHEKRQTWTQSHQDAARLVAPGAGESRVIVWDAHRWPDGLDQWLAEHDVNIVEYSSLPSDEPEPDPEPEPTSDPTWTPHNYVPTGTKMGWHAIGNCGLANMPNTKGGIDYGIYGADMIAPTIKLVRAISDIQYMPCTYPMVRLIDATVDGVPVNYQNFDYSGNPEAQAEARVHDLVRALSPYTGQFRWTELCNEQDIPDIEHAEMIARYSIRAMEVAPAWLGIAHFSFGTGNPGALEFWKPIADTGVFEKIAARGDALAFHSYHDHRVGGDLVWHLTRYRFLYNEQILLRQLDIPMVLTECGPWRHLFDDPTFDLMEWIRITDYWLSQDPYAMCQMYTVSDVPGWADYSDAFKSHYPQFIEYAISVKDRING